MNDLKIDSYRFGKIVIGGETYTKDVIIFPERVKSNWWREEGHSLSPKDLEEVIEISPQRLIIGTGASGRMQVPTETREVLEARGIQVIVCETQAACEQYNEVRDQGGVIAALHLTC